ncbi:Hypothetical protein FKW44_003607 [Caligus rogercresseyi]|uniref:Uncharacterized protein n=1 Tax=Caligus rogercresseyi TaxID=217165 RepID=A0A7T8KLW7_CALRO|nr:Hypothetical protein FKW44_003607 [Caligus rogercresseyi]
MEAYSSSDGGAVVEKSHGGKTIFSSRTNLSSEKKDRADQSRWASSPVHLK